MYLFLDEKTRKIIGFNETIDAETAKNYPNAVEYNGEFPHNPEKREGYKHFLYLEEDNKTIRIEYRELPKPTPTQFDRIETAMNHTLDEIRAEGAAAASVQLLAVGAELTEALAAAKMDVPATAGTFAGSWKEWTADGQTATAKSLWQYQGIGYQARTDIQKIEVYAPDKATNNYAVRPIPDANGIFPGMLNMDVSIGMKVRDWEDGKVYLCYANPITSLQWAPHSVPASFEWYEG